MTKPMLEAGIVGATLFAIAYFTWHYPVAMSAFWTLLY
jgi:hypothetical protein